MRDPRRKIATFTRTRRRAILVAAMLVAGSPALRGDQPGPTIRLMPPLPLAVTGSSEAAQGVQNNPFCPPEASGLCESPVQLASGNQVPAVRLKPIGVAVGLQPIGAKAPVKVESPGIKIEAMAQPRVQYNPLLSSQHHANPDLVETEVVAPNDQPLPNAFEATRPLQTMIPPVAPAPSSHVTHQSPGNPSPMKPVPLTAPEPAAEPSLAVEQEVEPTSDTSAESEPVFFSMSDDSETTLSQPEPTAEPTDGEESDPVVAEAPVAEIAPIVQAAPTPVPIEVTVDEPAKLAAEVDQEPVRRHPVAITAPVLELEQPVIVAQDQPVAIAAPVRPVPVAEAEPVPNMLDRRAPIVSAPVVKSNIETKAKRYRPPVAVVAPPLAIERLASEDASIVRPTVKPVEAPRFENDIASWDSIKVQKQGSTTKPMPKVSFDGKSSELTPLYLSRAQVRSLTVGGQLRRVSVADKNVCQAFAAGPNQLKLIGTGNGVTRLVVWADATDDAPTQVRSFEIHVDDAVDANGGAVGNKTIMLNQSIRKAFPNSTVKVKQFQDRLVVTGSCESEESAKKIVRMVRKTCLIPVRDELKVR